MYYWYENSLRNEIIVADSALSKKSKLYCIVSKPEIGARTGGYVMNPDHIITALELRYNELLCASICSVQIYLFIKLTIMV